MEQYKEEIFETKAEAVAFIRGSRETNGTIKIIGGATEHCRGYDAVWVVKLAIGDPDYEEHG